MEKFTRNKFKNWTLCICEDFSGGLWDQYQLFNHTIQAEWASAMLSVGVCRAAAVESFEGSMQSSLM